MRIKKWRTIIRFSIHVIFFLSVSLCTGLSIFELFYSIGDYFLRITWKLLWPENENSHKRVIRFSFVGLIGFRIIYMLHYTLRHLFISNLYLKANIHRTNMQLLLRVLIYKKNYFCYYFLNDDILLNQISCANARLK